MPPAPSNTPTAAPMAVSSWITSGDSGSAGSTVLRFTISGSGSAPPSASSLAASARRSIHSELVLKNWCRVMSWKASSSSSAVCADSRSTSWPSARRRARWPPLRSFSPRRETSIRNGSPCGPEPAQDARVERGAQVVGVGDEGRLVALLEQLLEQAGGHQRRVDVAVPGRAPLQLGVGLPGSPGPASPRPAWAPCSARSPAAGRPSARGSAPARPASRRGCGSCPSAAAARRRSTAWRAITSRKVSPSLTSTSDLALVMPMLVPRPPLSLITTALPRSLGVALGQLVRPRQVVDRLDVGLGQDPRVARRPAPRRRG